MKADFKNTLKKRVYFAARDGFIKTLHCLMTDHDSNLVFEILHCPTGDENDDCTPLIIAAKNGHSNLVSFLLNNYKIDIEQKGLVKFNGHLIEGATALWSAASAGHLKTVKVLLENGANVNHATKSKSTPLRVSCFNGRLDIVSTLVENGADVNLDNEFNNTCLMIASYKGHLDIVSYLTGNGVNINAKAKCGATALHFASDAGHTAVVKELLSHKAPFTLNESNMTPLILAADRGRSGVVFELIQHPVCSRSDKIDALEILGASYANDKDNYDICKAYHYLELAMKERYADVNDVISKKSFNPVEAYDFHHECHTLEELQVIRENHNALHMECLTLRERILGPDNPELLNQLIFRGAVFADSARYDRCLKLWIHGLKLCHRNKTIVSKDLLRFVQLFSQMIYIGILIQFHFVEEVLKYTVEVLETGQKMLETTDVLDLENRRYEHDQNVLVMLYLLVIICKLLKFNQSSQPSPVNISTFSESQKQNVMQLVYRVNQLQICDSFKSTLLHFAVSEDTYVDDFHTSDVCRFPCAATSSLLMECGADVNAIDSARNTPLHIIVKYQRPITDFLNLHSILVSLVDYGAHLDCVNAEGKTPYEVATTGVTEMILRSKFNFNLMCLAARSLQKYNLKYKGLVPKNLEKFIEMHGVPQDSKDSSCLPMEIDLE